ncbi:tRNA (N(6)-L-threonylcarbamoyladenosine(37)-C(2))-methylthiotransferase MtaB [Flavilitoribacter nigricans]|uniref:Threonylcarbamoyladenosine tRNA methylthiotransferase MtaB n=1 Tax=Flavilitoribacter nigricans (strain ATCC 23147 / DSM 23189 / NBRC 102662 / NCIMB 1420 / SS-2) TaxID=1122177 RepID=A0A2D0N5B5_FLAN2|nr:tRNA (N(6)-L-threonylcarbamoyladenosine(37)-C(2))-methylthiotransferase MtaB [Flavilitoribacter nigricans]PHN03694.1 tRNA (N(6)-L-threonylcarbamoyladenosine(37)-C(2))-methylthiotransferase MtaB [Flavilitoribacter nigricans DSM 23189 = NBRC 102662]
MATPRSVAFYTLGCKLNYSETSSIGRLFEEAGYTELSFNDGADIYVINTCSVTDFADRKCRQIVRRALRFNPQAKVIVVGCYAQLKPDEIADIPGVDLVLGAAEKFRILDFVEELSKAPGKGMVKAGEVSEAKNFVDAFSFGDRTRSFLKVQDGCDYKCTFCTIPMARGRSRSDTVEQVVSNACKIAELGVKEIVLTGVNIGDFGNGTEVIEGVRPKKEALFIDLIQALDEVEGIERFRISSIEPNLCTNEIIEFVAGSQRFVPHFHMPLQSGNNKQLRQMRRRYQRELYADRVAHIKKVMPHCCIGVDVIVGFPGETEEDFLESYRFLNELDISYLHVFTYSERPNTPAAEMDGIVPMQERRRRNQMLNILSDKKRRYFYEQHLGEKREVLFEQSKSESSMSGFTDNYIRVDLPLETGILNEIATVALEKIDEEGLMQARLAPTYSHQ